MFRFTASSCCVLLFFVGFSCVAHAQQATLSFVKSPLTDKHVALQPQKDHHRIHVLVRVVGGGGQSFEAELACQAREHTTSATVDFTALKSDQTWALYLRAAKRTDVAVQYTLKVRPANGGAGESLVYAWEIDRTPNGDAIIKNPPAGETSNIQYVVAVPVPSERSDGSIGWSFVYETRVVQVTVPKGFDFGVDQQNALTPIHVSAKVVN